MRRAVVALLTLGIGCAAPARTVPTPAAAAPAIGAVTAEELRRDLYAFAHDSMKGRETGTDDATRAMRFLVDRLTQLGLEPAGDSGFAQRVPMQKEVFGPETRIAVEEGGVIRSVKIGTEIVPLLNLGAGVPPTKRIADGEIVFVGYGLTLANPKRDDFAGLSLQGKVVVVVNGAPAGVDSAKRAELEGQGAISQRLAQILPQRPAAVIILLTGKGTELFEQSGPQIERAVALRSNAPEVPESERQIPMIMLGVPVVGSPLLPTGWPADDKAQALTGRRLTARVEQVKTPFTAYNVAAVVRGSDPTLSPYVRGVRRALRSRRDRAADGGRFHRERRGRRRLGEHGAARDRAGDAAGTGEVATVGDVRVAHRRGEGTARIELVHRSPDGADRLDRGADQRRHDRPQCATRCCTSWVRWPHRTIRAGDSARSSTA